MTVVFPKYQSGKYAWNGIASFIPAISFTPYTVIAYLTLKVFPLQAYGAQKVLGGLGFQIP
jgi:hypothetical protein